MNDRAERRKSPGRGALGNPSGRFERFRFVPEPEDRPGDPDDEPPRLATVVVPDATRTVIARNDSPDVPFDQSVNPYRGCEHGCVYCFARPSHSYLGLSPGLDFESRIFSKPEAPRLLAAELRKRGYRCKVLVLGANTDPYQPVERELRITRGILEVLRDHRHPVNVVTKSALVLRDLDVLTPMAAERLASVMISITTLDPALARTMEPRAASPRLRLAAIRALRDAGVPVGVLASPMIPAVNDAELERILAASADAGARWAGTILVRLPHEVKEIFSAWLAEHAPLKAKRVLARLRDLRNGTLDAPEFHTRMTGSGPYADLLARRFEVACRRLGLDTGRSVLETSLFRLPPRPGDQRSLFA